MTQAMSKHDEKDAENAEPGTQTLRVKVKDGSIKEQLCLQDSAPKGADEGLPKSANEDMQQLSLEDADKGSYESDDLDDDADEAVYRTLQGLNRPSFQPSWRIRDGPKSEHGGKDATYHQRSADGSCEAVVCGEAAEEVEEGDADDFENIDEESADEDEDVGDARKPGRAV
ncbi:hypothetical protein ACQKWADRAFT_291049 [Trichoderma austrokoningii]